LPSQYRHIFVEDHELCGSVIGGQDSRWEDYTGKKAERAVIV